MLPKELSTDTKVVLIMDSIEERKNDYKMKQQMLLKKYHEVVFKGLPFVRFQNYVKECFESLNWYDDIDSDSIHGFMINNYPVSLGTWQVYRIEKYKPVHKRFRWDDDIVYQIILYDRRGSHSVDFNAFTAHQLLGICIACLRQAICDTEYETL